MDPAMMTYLYYNNPPVFDSIQLMIVGFIKNYVSVSATTIFVLTAVFTAVNVELGIAMMESGFSCNGNSVIVIVKDLLNFCINCAAFFLVGWGLIQKGDGFAGNTGFAYTKVGDEDFYEVLYLFSIVSFASALVSSGMTGKVRLSVQLLIISIFASIIFPIVIHWTWEEEGWLTKIGLYEYGGMTGTALGGSVAGIFATWYLGPREHVFTACGKFLPVHNNPAQALMGLGSLYCGWVSIMAAGALGVMDGLGALACYAVVLATIGFGFGFFVSYLISVLTCEQGKYVANVGMIIRGSVAGMIATTAVSSTIEPWESAVIGTLGCLASHWMANVMERYRIDDPSMLLCPTFAGSTCGLLFVGLFAHDTSDLAPAKLGLFYGGTLRPFCVQLLAVVMVTLWSVGAAAILMKALDMAGRLRVTIEQERMGMDVVDLNLVRAQLNPKVKPPRKSRVNATDIADLERSVAALGMHVRVLGEQVFVTANQTMMMSITIDPSMTKSVGRFSVATHLEKTPRVSNISHAQDALTPRASVLSPRVSHAVSCVVPQHSCMSLQPPSFEAVRAEAVRRISQHVASSHLHVMPAGEQARRISAMFPQEAVPANEVLVAIVDCNQ